MTKIDNVDDNYKNFRRMNLISFAFSTRVFIILLQTLSNGLIPDHDANVFITPQKDVSSATTTWPDWIIECLLGGLARWDANYFLHIATNGYSYEQTLAFYPLYPFIVGLIAKLLYTALPILSLYYYALVVATLLNILFFIKATECIFELSLRLTGNKKWATNCAILFCLNPASIFFTAPYSEALFAWLTFKVMLETAEAPLSIHVVIPLSLSLATRSNGIINLGYVGYFALKAYMVQPKKVNKIGILCRTALIVITSLFLYGLTQLYFYYLFCAQQTIQHEPIIIEYAVKHDLILAGLMQANNSVPAWCKSDIPISYSYVQNRYWNVGFLNYYQWKQIPNFLLAAPALILVMNFCFTYFRAHISYCLHLGLFENKVASKKITLFERQIFPFVVHSAFLAIFCTFFVHIQVSTRLLASSSPILYWLCANHFRDASINGFEDIRDIIFLDKSEARRLILCYFVGYALVGTILFSNFLPWT